MNNPVYQFYTYKLHYLKDDIWISKTWLSALSKNESELGNLLIRVYSQYIHIIPPDILVYIMHEYIPVGIWMPC
jgi:hypothetical protein